MLQLVCFCGGIINLFPSQEYAALANEAQLQRLISIQRNDSVTAMNSQDMLTSNLSNITDHWEILPLYRRYLKEQLENQSCASIEKRGSTLNDQVSKQHVSRPFRAQLLYLPCVNIIK